MNLIAKNITAISKSAKELLNSGLTKRAIVVLIQDSMKSINKLGKKEIEDVLDTLPELEKIYCTNSIADDKATKSLVKLLEGMNDGRKREVASKQS